MKFASGDFDYVAGNLATEPILGRFPDADGLFDEVVWMTVAVNHSDGPTEYVELEARGRTKEYVKNMAASPVRPLGKGTFVMAGGKWGKKRNGKRKLRLVVFSAESSLSRDVLDWGYLDKSMAQAGAQVANGVHGEQTR